MSDFTCRIAETTDHTVLADLRWRLNTDDAPEFDRASYDDYVQRFVDWAEGDGQEGCRHWVVESGGRVVGAMTVVLVTKVPKPGEPLGRWGYLTNSYVLPEARNSGAGSALLEAISDWARQCRLEMVLVWPSERAYPFYERMGFQSVRDPLVLDLTPPDPPRG